MSPSTLRPLPIPWQYLVQLAAVVSSPAAHIIPRVAFFGDPACPSCLVSSEGLHRPSFEQQRPWRTTGGVRGVGWKKPSGGPEPTLKHGFGTLAFGRQEAQEATPGNRGRAVCCKSKPSFDRVAWGRLEGTTGKRQRELQPRPRHGFIKRSFRSEACQRCWLVVWGISATQAAPFPRGISSKEEGESRNSQVRKQGRRER